MTIIILSTLLTLCSASEKIFIACEGNFYQSNGSVWAIEDDNIYEYYSELGEIVQSLYIYDNMLFVIVNGSSNIQIFEISDENISLIHVIDTQFSGPREMLIYNGYLYFSNWYTADIKKLNLSTLEIETGIAMPGLPEDIVLHNILLYISINMNYDWTDGNSVVFFNA